MTDSWEYWTEFMHANHLEKKLTARLNELGRTGWRLSATIEELTPPPIGPMLNGVFLVFERPAS